MTTSSKRPSFQFYPGDEERDTELMSCSLLAYGLWKRMLNLMHDAEPYGHLTVAGKPMTEAALAKRVGESPARVRALLAELEAANVFSRTDAGVIYSRRMVEDERKRNVRAAGGRLGGNPALLDPPATPDVGRKDKPNDARKVGEKVNHPETSEISPSSSSSSSSSEEPTTTTPSARERADAEEAALAAEVADADRALRPRLPVAYHGDLDGLLRRIPTLERRLSWLRSLAAKLDGDAGDVASPDVVAEALRQFNTNGETSWKRFLGYVGDLSGSGAGRGEARTGAPSLALVRHTGHGGHASTNGRGVPSGDLTAANALAVAEEFQAFVRGGER